MAASMEAATAAAATAASTEAGAQAVAVAAGIGSVPFAGAAGAMAASGQVGWAVRNIHRMVWKCPRYYDGFNMIGCGSFGSVCEACRADGIRVAVKKLQDPFQSVPHAQRAFREIRLLKYMQHENIIAMVDLFRSSAPGALVPPTAFSCSSCFLSAVVFDQTRNTVVLFACWLHLVVDGRKLFYWLKHVQRLVALRTRSTSSQSSWRRI
eukprot:m.94047 g.94047  ORF g.94047 m.94047 type:complete len:209 (+) comp15109_c0_seq6:122-748(+)